MTDHGTPQDFADFLDSTASATYEDVRALPDSQVESAAAFEEMRAYVLELYDDAGVEDTLVESDGRAIDCIPAGRHPALRATGDTAPSPPTAAPPPPEAPAPAPDTPPPGYQEGSAAREYPPGTVPMYRTTLEQLARFPTLAAFTAKDGFEAVAAGAGGAATGKRYATGEQDLGCLGGGSRVNVWKTTAFIAPGLQATFSQQWYVSGLAGTLLQTVECGWHVDYARYQNFDPHLFVFATRNNYATGDGFFNQDGGAFSLAANPPVLPGAPLPASQTDGAQVDFHMGFYLTAGAWWFYFQNQPVGCYPLTWFNSGPLTAGAERARFGGEVGSGLPPWPPMGSGQHAAAGFGKAAYQRAATVYPTGGGAPPATLAEAGSVTGTCYTVDITNNSSDADWGTYLFFGGPGGPLC